jgi:hypothetical protein
LLDEIEKNTRYDLSFKEIDALKAMMEKEKYDFTINILKKEGYTITQIAKLTGLSKTEIQNIKQ